MSRKLFATWLLIPIVFGLALLTGCGGGSSTVVLDHFVEFTPEEREELQANRGTYYRIQEGDKFSVAFSYLEDLNQDEILVLPDGSINMMGVDRLELAGLTIMQADSLITQAYSRDYRDPQLSLILRDTKGRQVYVMGEVQKPGLHSLPRGGVDILGAISTAGGFTDDAARGGTIVVRAEPNGYLVKEINLSDLHDFSRGQISLVALESYDIVYVPRSGMGSFGYFSRTVLAGLVQLTRIASDLKYVAGSGSFLKF